MANPWGIATMSPAVAVLGWLLSPIINWLLQNLFAYLIFDATKELPELELVTVPALKLTLREVEEHRMLRAARGDEESSRSDLERLDKMDILLKSALYQAEDILDLVHYYQIEKKITGKGSSSVQRLITAAVACIARCCRWIRVKAQGLLHTAGAWIAGRWGTLIQRCIDITPAPLLQFVHSMKQKLGQLFGGVISLWSSGALLPVSQATSSVGVQRLCGWCSKIVANITSCYRSLLSWCTDRIPDARYYRDWSYEQVGFNVNEKEILLGYSPPPPPSSHLGPFTDVVGVDGVWPNIDDECPPQALEPPRTSRQVAPHEGQLTAWLTAGRKEVTMEVATDPQHDAPPACCAPARRGRKVLQKVGEGKHCPDLPSC